MSKGVLGIDVAQASLEVMLLQGQQQARLSVANMVSGFETLQAWVASHGVTELHVCLEATGHYGDGVALYFQALGCRVSVVNPVVIKRFSQLRLARHKTDKVDADQIAHYCQMYQPAPWQPLDAATLDLRAVVRRLAALEEARQQERNRLKARLPSSVTNESIQSHLDYLEAEIKRLKQHIQDYIQREPTLQRLKLLLTSIKGVGALTAARLIAEIGDLSRFESVEQLVAFLGLDPSHHESGTSVRQPTHISKKGNTRLRAALYLPAVSAKNHNPIIRDFCSHLQSRGKSPKAIVVAAMRKLIHLVYGIWKSGKPFDPLFLAQKA